MAYLNLDDLRRLGFDRSRAIAFSRAHYVGCSQCEALCINGVPTHERGCPNQPVECRECGSLHADRQAAAECCSE